MFPNLIDIFAGNCFIFQVYQSKWRLGEFGKRARHSLDFLVRKNKKNFYILKKISVRQFNIFRTLLSCSASQTPFQTRWTISR